MRRYGSWGASIHIPFPLSTPREYASVLTMTPSQVIKWCGGTPTKTAQKLKVSRQVVSNWKKRGVPLQWQIQLYGLSNGELRLGGK